MPATRYGVEKFHHEQPVVPERKRRKLLTVSVLRQNTVGVYWAQPVFCKLNSSNAFFCKAFISVACWNVLVILSDRTQHVFLQQAGLQSMLPSRAF